MHIYVCYSEISQKLSTKPMYLYSTSNFWSKNTHNTPGWDGIIFITNAGRIRLPSSIVKLNKNLGIWVKLQLNNLTIYFPPSFIQSVSSHSLLCWRSWWIVPKRKLAKSKSIILFLLGKVLLSLPNTWHCIVYIFPLLSILFYSTFCFQMQLSWHLIESL